MNLFSSMKSLINKIFILFFVIFLWKTLFSNTTLSNQPFNNINISIEISESEATIGDNIKYTLRVEYPTKYKIELPLNQKLTVFELKDFNRKEGKISARKKFSELSYTLSTWVVGKYFIPPSIIKINGKDIFTGSVPISIKSLLTGKDGLRDLKPPFVPERTYRFLIIIFSILLAVALGFVFVYFIKNRKKLIEILNPQKKLTPIEAFSEAYTQALVSFNNQYDNYPIVRELYFLLDDILTYYLSGEFNLSLTENTTSEKIDLIKENYFLKKYLSELMELFSTADMVKFAKFFPDKRTLNKYTSFLKNTVERINRDKYTSQQEDIELNSDNKKNINKQEKNRI